MRKKLFLISICLIFITTLSSCSLLFGSASLEYDYDPDKMDEIRELMVEAEGYLEAENNYDIYYDTYIDINMFAYELVTYYQKENILYSMDGNSESPIKMQEFYSYFMEIAEWQTDILVETYNSTYKDEFFKDWTEKEIQAIFDADYPTEYYNLSNKEEELKTEFQAYDRLGAIENAPIYLKELVDVRRQMATIAGFENYFFYAYESMYGRDYSIPQINLFSTYVKQYLVPIAYQLDDKLDYLESLLTEEEYNEIHFDLFANSIEDRELVDSYMKKVGNSFKYEYNFLTNRGHFYYSNHENAQQAAYTTFLYWDGLPAVYFGPGYQNSFTLVHEFGHYYAAARTNEITSSNDLAETQSQGNEMLFLGYLMQFSDYSDTQKEYLKTRQLYEALSIILISSIINDFEMAVYAAQAELTPEVLDSLINLACESYGGVEEVYENIGYDPTTYWKLVCVENPFYYISYAMSLIPAIGIYNMAMEDFDKAKNCYLDLCEVKDIDFLEALSTTALYSPFDEAVYIKLSDLFA